MAKYGTPPDRMKKQRWNPLARQQQEQKQQLREASCITHHPNPFLERAARFLDHWRAAAAVTVVPWDHGSTSSWEIFPVPGVLALALLSAFALFLWRRTRKSWTKEQRRGVVDPTPTRPPTTLGSRGHAARDKQTVPHYIQRHVQAFELGLYDAISRPSGYISLCVAENKLAVDLLSKQFLHRTSLGRNHWLSDQDGYCYNSPLGLPHARAAAATFLNRRFLDPCNRRDGGVLRRVLPEHVVLGAGAAPLLGHLFFLLGDAGVPCLVPAPYYAAFDIDMNAVAGVVPFPVHPQHPALGPTPEEFEAAFVRAIQTSGRKPRFLLLTHPHNPLGCVYAPTVVQSAVKWARSHGMHTIVDEIYALSSVPAAEYLTENTVEANGENEQSSVQFQSVMEILDNDLQSDVHVVWALSKDFGASGVRFGVLYTQNESLLQCLSTFNAFTGASGPVQNLVADAIFLDDAFVDSYLADSRKRLRHSYALCTRTLSQLQLPFVPAQAGIFVYANLSSLLPEPTHVGEYALSQALFHYARLILTPGEAQHDPQPGWFRICYAWVPPEVLQVAMDRLARLATTIQAGGWDHLPLKDETSGEAMNEAESFVDKSLRDSVLGQSFHFV